MSHRPQISEVPPTLQAKEAALELKRKEKVRLEQILAKLQAETKELRSILSPKRKKIVSSIKEVEDVVISAENHVKAVKDVHSMQL